MPTYEYYCPSCGLETEVVHTMAEVDTIKVVCTCSTRMRRKITGGAGVIFKGDGWPSKEFRQQDADRGIQKARRKAKRLKESGVVPWEEQIKASNAGAMHDKFESAMRKAETEKALDGTLEKEMDKKISEE